ncbi:MAG: nickel pincer cofactor biosynthesis protein LarC [Gemmatimonadota bacterium]|nr:MAG: nickel pincer cofactor biosynthesis protein LarC [Gemmatimonadota bacterium]
MRIAILDPFAGISGDMTLGCLIDVGGDSSWLSELPARLGFPHVRVRIGKTTRSSVTATKVDFDVPESHEGGHHGRTVAELQDIVRRAPITTSVRDGAVRAFELIGAAEGRVHGLAPERVHLHEVGAVDALLDIVGALEGFERLGVDRVYSLPVATGSGWVEAAHGKLPVPAPATVILLEGMTVRELGPVTGEATTPTGAALLRVLSRGTPPDRWRITASGWGAGDRNPDGYPNALRLILAEDAPEAGVVEMIATDVDDLSPEYIEPLRSALFAAGALDCLTWTTQGKKGRVSLRIEVAVPASDADAVVEALFANSSTAGVRRWIAARSTLARDEVTVQLEAGHEVRVKLWHGPRGLKIKPEYRDVIEVASITGVPALEVARQAERKAETILGEKGYKFP